jgi:hypothetical protein
MTAAMDIPRVGDKLSKDEAVALAGQWRSWHGELSDVLLVLDEQSRQVGTDSDRTDVAELFVSWSTVGERVNELETLAANGKTIDLSRLSWEPVARPDAVVLGPNLAAAADQLMDTCISLRSRLSTRQNAQAAVAMARAQGNRDAEVATRLATELGELGRHVGELCERWRAATTDEAMALISTELATARATLEASKSARDDAIKRLTNAPALVEDLTRQAASATAALTGAREKVAPAPPMATPSVDALGPAPDLTAAPWSSMRATASAWLVKADRLTQAFAEIERRCRLAIDERDELRGRLQAFRDKAASVGAAERPDVDRAYQSARQVLWSAPCDMVAARSLVAAYIELVNR